MAQHGQSRDAIFVFPSYLSRNLEGLTISFLYFDTLLIGMPTGVLPPTSDYLRQSWQQVSNAVSEDCRRFLRMVLSQRQQAIEDSVTASDLLQPLKEQGVVLTFAYAYPGGSSVWQQVEELFDKNPGLAAACDRAVDPAVACCEFARHVFLERYLELGKSARDLASYVQRLFEGKQWDDILVRAMALRFMALPASETPSILATSASSLRAIGEFGSVMAEGQVQGDGSEVRDVTDVIACEVFHRILRPLLGRFDESHIGKIAELRAQRYEELVNLRDACYDLATGVGAPLWSPSMAKDVERLIRRRLTKPIAEMLDINSRAVREYFDSLLSDPGFLATLVLSVVGALLAASGQSLAELPPELQMGGGASGALSVLAARAYAAWRKRATVLAEHELSFVYYLHRSFGSPTGNDA